MRTKTIFSVVGMLMAVLLLTACGGGLGSGAGSDALGGTVNGLSPLGKLTLQNGLNTTVVTANGRFSMASVSYGVNYLVRVTGQPAGQNCTVLNDRGTVTGDINNVQVSCTRLPARFAYVLTNAVNTNPSAGIPIGAATGPGRLEAYSVVSGAMSPLVVNQVAGGVNTELYPIAMAMDPTGHYVFVVSAPTSSTGKLAAYGINSSGVLSAATPVPFAIADSPTAVAVDPSGKYIYVTTAGGVVQAYSYSFVNGIMTLGSVNFQSTGSSPSAVTVDPTGQYVLVSNYGSNTLSVFGIEPATGALLSGFVNTPVETSGNPNPSAVVVGPAGTSVYTANPGSGSVSALDLNSINGNLLLNASYNAYPGARSLAIDPNGAFLLVLNLDVATPNVSFVPIQSGILQSSQSTNLGFTDSLATISLDPTGAYAYVTSPGQSSIATFAVDSVNGVLAATALSRLTDPPLAVVTTIGPH